MPTAPVLVGLAWHPVLIPGLPVTRLLDVGEFERTQLGLSG